MTRLGAPATWLALASLVVVPVATDAFELPHQLVLALGVVVVALTAEVRPSRALGVVGAAWLGVLALGTSTSQARSLSFPLLVTFATCVGLSLGVRRDERWSPVVWTAWPIAAWALLQGVGRDVVEWGNVATWCGGLRPFSTLGHPTQLGVWMALVTVLALEEARVAPSARTRAFLWLSGAVAALTCVATLSRAGWLALGVGVLAWWWLQPARDPRSLRWLLGAGAVVALLAMGVAGPSALAERAVHALVAPTRVQLWGTALSGFAVHPWLGWGPGAFLLVDQQYRHPDAWRLEWGTTATHAHSFPAEVLATLGLVGAVVVVACAAFVVRRWRRAPTPLIAVPLALAAASMVSFAGALVLALGWAVLAATLAEPDDAAARRATPMLVLGLSSLVVTALLFGASLLTGLASRAPTVELAAARLSAAPTLDLWTGEGLAVEGGWLEQRGDLVAARRAYEAAAQRTPGLAAYEADVGRVASKLGQRDDAHAWFELARRHAPLDARIALDAADAAVRLGELELADATLSRVLAAYPTDGPAWFLLAQLRLSQQRGVEARAALEAGLGGDWRDWPEGFALACALLARVQEGLGDPALAAQTRASPPTWTAPGDICGAPALLAR